MPRPPEKRTVEALLLAATLFVTLCGLALTFFGKSATTPLPPNALNINKATAGELKQALSIDNTTARAIIADREKRPGHVYAAVYDLRRFLKKTPTALIGYQFVVRSSQTVALGFWGGTGLFALAFLLAHFVLRRAAPRADPFLLPLVVLLSGFGLMMVYTVKDPYRDTFVFAGQVWGTVLYGLIALLIPLTRPFGKLPLRRYQYVYAAGAIVLMLMLASPLGHGPGGIHIRLFGFEPVEVIKVLLVFFVAAYLADRQGKLGDAKAVLTARDFGPLGVIYAFALGLFVILKDLGPAVLLFGAFLTLLYLTTQKVRYPIFGTVLLLAAAVVGYKLHFGFFVTRVTMWLHPWANGDPRGAQLGQGLWGMATGGLWGSGLGMGQPAFMPRAGSDLIFASIGEEMGLVGTLSVLVIYVLLIARGFRIALRAVTDFDRNLAAGLTTLLALQTMIITGGVTGLVPLTGMTLPFVSFGASSLVTNFFLIGVLLHLSDKTLPTTVADRVTPEWTRAARVVALGAGVYLLFGIGVLRLMAVQGVWDDALAAHSLSTPDADGVARPHFNPRLLTYAAAIPHGRILDRNGAVLARDASGPDDAGATALFTSDGRQRIYPGGAACAQIVANIESSQNRANPLGSNGLLRGYATYADLLPLYRSRYGLLPPHPKGTDVTLTLDLDTQRAALDALRRYARTGRGAAVALNSATGEVLAAVSLPTFDPATVTAEQWQLIAVQPAGPLFNRAISGLYPPGSVFKIVTASSALQNGQSNRIFNCAHTLQNVVWRSHGKPYARRLITDETGFVPHGQTDLAKALRVSCNVYFAQMGLALGADKLDQTARGFDLAHLPSLAKWGEDLPDCAYGQGAVLVTPLEMAHVAQTVANNGRSVSPIWIKRGNVPAVRTVLTAAQAAELQTMLAGVTTTGTARGVFDGLKVSVAGKTGSAQTVPGKPTHSWFAGFAPATNPTLAFACVIENGGAGRDAAAPVCREIVRKAL